MNDKKLDYICRMLLEVDWVPELTAEAMRLLDKCDSTLEPMYLLGAIYFLEQTCRSASNGAFGDWPLKSSYAKHEDETVAGVYGYGVWPSWIHQVGSDCGPQSIMIAPQVKFAKKFHHDFGIFYGNKYGDPQSWKLKYGVEVDGYTHHKNSRKNDKYRDSLVAYPVIRLLEEMNNPLTWFELVMKEDLWEQARYEQEMYEESLKR